jgi:hypothetical protein
MSRIIMWSICLFVAMIFISVRSVAEVTADNLLCSSVSSTNIRNSTINEIKFEDGKACTSDDPALPNQCDWEHEISRDEIPRPISGKEVRLVIVRSNHKTGSGAWDTLLVFDCFNGIMKNIFEKKYLYGVGIKKNTDRILILISGNWRPKDPQCCPSQEKHETYRWNSSENTYKLARFSKKTEKRAPDCVQELHPTPLQ